jgi:hypothetical protein
MLETVPQTPCKVLVMHLLLSLHQWRSWWSVRMKQRLPDGAIESTRLLCTMGK